MITKTQETQANNKQIQVLRRFVGLTKELMGGRAITSNFGRF